jgi:ABC-type phosphate transport system substrate-binding protein
MGQFSARRAISACAISAAALAACVVPSAASAVTQCSGASPIVGAGSSAQKLAQKEVWDSEAAPKSGFNVSTNADACSGKQGTKAKPEVKYESIGSGGGLEKWGVKGHAFEAGAFAFVGTDEPVNAAQKEEIEKNETTVTAETVQSIPVVQFSVSVPIHLPEGCTATNTAGVEGRLVLENTTLEKIFRGEITKWSEITSSGDKLEGATCKPETEITKIVRLDGSGTTHVFKKYLGLINKAGKFETEKAELKTWDEISEGAENTTWPKAGKTERPAGKGGGEVVAKVAATPSSIGYANLADARKTFGGAGSGPKTEKFWAEVENNGTVTKTPTYADPATNGDVEALANSNCEKEKYTNGSGTKFPPETTAKTWNTVTTETKQLKYTLCGITYDMGLSSYGAYPGTSAGEAQAALDYLQFVEDTAVAGGQPEIVGHDYEKLPSSLTDIAQDGADILKF